MRRRIYSLFLIIVLSCGSALAHDARHKPGFQGHFTDLTEYKFCKHVLKGEIFERTELYFGTNKPGGAVVSDQEFQAFIDAEVTPRFPDGLTLLSGDGQFRNAAGTIEKERSKLLILFYLFSAAANQAVEEIRDRYKSLHEQQSVLRVDEQSCVSF